MSAEYDKIFIVEKPSFSDYVIDGNADPEITLVRGETYLFDFTTDGHPFYIKSSLGYGTAGQYDSGVINQGSSSANQDLIFTVPDDAPDTLYYQCSAHYPMSGVIKIVDPNPAAVVVPEHTGFGGLDFQLDASKYQMYFFEGAFGEVVVDPTDSGNTVVKFIRTAESKHYAGVLLGYLDGFKVDEIPVDLEAGNTTIKARIWSPNDGIVAGMQITDSVETGKGNNYFNVFTQVTLSKGWNDAVFDFSKPVDRYVDEPNGFVATPIEPTATYDRLSLYLDWENGKDFAGNQVGTALTENVTYYIDNVILGFGEPVYYEGASEATEQIKSTFSHFKNHVLSILDDSSATPPSATTDADLNGYTLVFEDTFDSIESGPNAANWTFDLGDDGWGNGEAQAYQSGLDNAQIIDWDTSSEINGALRITAKNVEGIITSARVKSDIDIGPYGYYEVRAKLPSEDGAWPAIWLLGEGGRNNWPNDGEIDFVEWSSAYATADTQIISALHYPAAHGRNANDTTTNLPTPVDDWHTYQLWWTPDAIKIGVDGTEADAHLVYSKPNNATNHAWPYDGPMDMILNIAVGGNLGGEVPSSNFEYTMDVDYVRIYQMEGLEAPEVSSKLTITYESDDYSGYIHYDFERNSSIVLSASDAPQSSDGAVLQITKTTGASEIAGTVLFDLLGNGELINADSSVVSMDVLSPKDDVKVRLKLEDSTDQNIFIELDAYTESNGSDTWETLTWDLSTANGLDHNNSYDKAVVFLDFGSLGDNSLYYIDNVLFNGYIA